jgi:hypothetical protein
VGLFEFFSCSFECSLWVFRVQGLRSLWVYLSFFLWAGFGCSGVLGVPYAFLIKPFLLIKKR